MGKNELCEGLEAILASDPRFHRDAYHFVREGLDYTQKQITQQKKGRVGHVTGQELLGGLRAYALNQYGPMTMLVLNEWGVKCCEDFGEIVFNMVEHKLLAKTEQDSRADFLGGYDFQEAFRKPFQLLDDIRLPEHTSRPDRNPPSKSANRPTNPQPKKPDKA